MKYYTTTEGIGGVIKTRPEDFIVEEIINFPPEGNEHTIYKLIRRNIDIYNVLRTIKKKLGISYSRFGFCGIKDKNALTIQYISIWKVDVDFLEGRNWRLIKVKKSKRKLKPSDLVKNKFKIIVRDIERKTVEETLKQLDYFPNYFGIQRFGIRFINHVVGRLILEKKLEEAIEILLTFSPEDENPRVKEARKLCLEGNYKEALNVFPKSMRIERLICDLLLKNFPYEKIILSIPKSILTIFPHAYQSYLFNKLVEKKMERILGVLPGYKIKIPEEIREDLNEILEEENVDIKLFKGWDKRIRCPGDYRYIMEKYENFKFEYFNNSVLFEFELLPGCFATSLLREFMKNDLEVWKRLKNYTKRLYEKYVY